MNSKSLIYLSLFLLKVSVLSAQPFKPTGSMKLLPVNISLFGVEDQKGLELGVKNPVWEESSDKILGNTHKQFYQTVFVELGARVSVAQEPFDHTGTALYLSGSYKAKGTRGWFVEPSLLYAYRWRLFHKREMTDSGVSDIEMGLALGYDRSTFRDSHWIYYIDFGFATQVDQELLELKPKFTLGINYLFYGLKLKRARKYCS